MPVPETHVPKICQQKGRNRAFVRFGGKTIYLGRWGSAQSRQAYDQIIREWLDNGRSLPERVAVSPASPDGGTIDTIDTLCADYLQFARGYYRKYDHQTEEVVCLESVIRVWLNLFPMLPVFRVEDQEIKAGTLRGSTYFSLIPPKPDDADASKRAMASVGWGGGKGSTLHASHVIPIEHLRGDGPSDRETSKPA